MRMRSFLTLAAVLVLGTGAAASAQEAAPAAAPAFVAPAATLAPPASTSDLPFSANGANQPVLQTLSTDGVPVTAQHSEGGEHKQAGLPQFDPTTFTKQIFWLVITFVFMYVFFSRKTLPTIGAVIDKREAKVTGDVRAAEELKLQVDSIKSQYEAAMASAQADAQKRIMDVQNEIKAATTAQDAAFKDRADEAVKATEAKIAAARTRILAELNTVAADLTVDITARLTGIKTDTATARDAINGVTMKAKAA